MMFGGSGIGLVKQVHLQVGKISHELPLTVRIKYFHK
jgi:hypothetical protein